MLVIGMYRPPGLLKATWEHEINDILRSTQRFESIMLIGDLNCDLSQPDKGAKEGKTLMDLMDVYGLTNLIKVPTRVVVESSSLIDVILTNKPRSILTSGVFDLCLSDFNLIYIVMRLQCPKFSPRTVVKRHFKKYDTGFFLADIATVPFHVAHIFHDPEDVFWAWGKLLSDALDVHVPVKRCISKRPRVPFMTPELLGSIRHRNKLRKLYFESKDPGDWEKYRLQFNLTSSLRRREISSYLRSRADGAKGDPKQFWHTIKPFMHCNNEGTYHLKENGGILVTDKKEVAEIFNNYFSLIQNVGEEHDSDSDVAVDISVHPSIAAIREECGAAQFEFDHVSVVETELILQSCSCTTGWSFSCGCSYCTTD